MTLPNLDRAVFLNGDVDATMEKVRRELSDLAKGDKDKGKPITLVITSFGGLVCGAMALVDTILAIRASGTPVDSLATGYAASAAIYIMAACRRRYAGPYAELMVHGCSSTMTQLDLDAIGAETGRLKVLADKLADLLGKRSAYSAAYWRKQLNSNRRLDYTPPQALQAGIIDEIMPDFSDLES